MGAIDTLGSEEQKQRWLPDMAACRKLGAFALTEPDHGSDVVRLDTRARRDGNSWVLDGAKRWIGNGTIAGLVLVWARDDARRVGGFLIDRRDSDAAGYEAARIVGKASNRALWQADIRLGGVRVPLDHRLAGSRSFADTSRCLTKSRQTIAWEGLGHAIAAFECALAYVKRREQFGRPLAGFQLIQDKLSSMLVDIMQPKTTAVVLEAEDKDAIEAGRVYFAPPDYHLLVPLALRGVRYRPVGANALLRRNVWLYGLGGIVAPFIGIKLVDLVVHTLLGACR